MARAIATKAYANFSGGFVTELNQLTPPENVATDIDNMDLVEDGSAQLRAGLKFDASTAISFPSGGRPLVSTATNVFKWKAVNGNPDRNIAVVQVGDELHFYYLKDDLVSATSVAAPTLVLQDTLRPSASTKNLRFSANIQAVSGGGRLYVAGKYIDPFVLTFNEPEVEFEEGTITQTDLILKIRDFTIAGEGETIDGYSAAGEEEQLYMSGKHFYNLANQGWPSSLYDRPYDQTGNLGLKYAICSTSSNPNGGTTNSYPAAYTKTKVGFYPTVYKSFHAYQAGGGDTVSEQIAYSPWLLENDYTGNTFAPRGSLIKEAFYLYRYAQGGYDGSLLPLSSELTAGLVFEETVAADTRPETIAFYAGRIWYAGLEGGQFTNNIYFSQVVGDDLNKAAKCYQEADPTAEIINELIATDGGLINLEEAGKIYKIAPIGPSLCVIADNGVWVISGDGEFNSFSATSFSIRKVTDRGAVNAESIVFAKDSVYYWGQTALYVLRLGEIGALEASDLTSLSIKRFFQETNAYAKQGSFSIFDEGANRIMWFYSNVDTDDYDQFPNKAFNKVLYYDIGLDAFGKYSLNITPDILVVSAINADILTQLEVTDYVTDGGVIVTDSGDPLTVNVNLFVPDRTSIKLLTVVTNGDSWDYRFSDFTDVEDWADWGVEYTGYIKTVYDSLGDIISQAKKAPILQVYCKRTETGFELNPDDPDNEEIILKGMSSCLVSYRWDWNSVYKNQFQAYKLIDNYIPTDVLDSFNYERDLISTRNRIRGRGTSFGLLFESSPGYDMRIVGYGIVFSNRGRV